MPAIAASTAALIAGRSLIVHSRGRRRDRRRGLCGIGVGSHPSICQLRQWQLIDPLSPSTQVQGVRACCYMALRSLLCLLIKRDKC